MNLKKIICEAFGKTWLWCSHYWESVLLCTETRLRARPECPVVKIERMLKDDVPINTCSMHVPSPPPPEMERMCQVNGQIATRWCPRRSRAKP